MRMYAITVFKSFQGHVVGPPTQSTGTILLYLISCSLLGLWILLVLRRSARHLSFFEFCSIYFFFYICCYIHFDFDTYIP